jgi:DDE superfamily endonuclease
MNTPEWEALRAFRQQVYPLFGCRRDALFETLDAVLSAPTLETPAHLSLAPSYQRGWGSLYDALNSGTMDLTRLERLVALQPIVAGWNYSWLVQVPRRCSSWTAPLRVRRIISGENVNIVAASQIRSWLEQTDPPAHIPIFTSDAGYDAVQLSLALADLPVGLLVRLRAGRCFYADPDRQPPTGRPRRPPGP